jgi:hypothetical protein
MTTREPRNHRHNLNTSNKRGLSVAQGVGSVSLFLFTTAELFPGTTRLLLGDLEFAAHLLQQLLGLDFVLFGFLGGRKGIGSALAFFFQLAVEVRLHFLGAFLLSTGVEEPALELAFGGGS